MVLCHNITLTHMQTPAGTLIHYLTVFLYYFSLDQGVFLCRLWWKSRNNKNRSKFTQHSWHYLSLWSLLTVFVSTVMLSVCVCASVWGDREVFIVLQSVGETIVVFFFLSLTECSSKSEECSCSEAAEESKLVVIRWGDGPSLEKDPHSSSLSSSSHT